MPLDFVKYLNAEMRSIGYETRYEETKATHAFMRFSPTLSAAMNQNMYDAPKFGVYYIRQPIADAEWIREAFKANSPTPLLFVVDQQLLADTKAKIALGQAVPLWLRALHAIYYGRIYTWLTGEGIKAFHINWDKSDFAYSETIVIDRMVFTETDSLLRDFPGQFKIARFTDDAFWKRDPNAPPRAKKEKRNPYEAPKGSYEDFARNYYQQGFWGYDPGVNNYSSARGNPPPKDMPREGESFNDYFKRIFEEDLRRRQAHHPPPPPPRNQRSYQVDDQWLAKMLAAGNLDGAKKVYRELSRQYHPDINKEPNATEVMQAINNAYDKAKVMLS